MTSPSSAAGRPGSAPRSCSAARGAASWSSTRGRPATLPPPTCRASCHGTGPRRATSSPWRRGSHAATASKSSRTRSSRSRPGFTLRACWGRLCYSASASAHDRRVDKLPTFPGAARALGPRLPPLPLLPWLGGARPGDRRPRNRSRLRRARAAPAAMVGGRLLLLPHSHPQRAALARGITVIEGTVTPRRRRSPAPRRRARRPGHPARSDLHAPALPPHTERVDRVARLRSRRRRFVRVDPNPSNDRLRRLGGRERQQPSSASHHCRRRRIRGRDRDQHRPRRPPRWRDAAPEPPPARR